ncbi:MAG: hypothetical protein HZA91_01615, partial [Verrucomicrobia bacterium]|nr:hypothetical protein [Verrucomicrobiota bacterium]
WQVSRKDRGLGVLATACYGGGVIVFGFESNPRYLLPVLPLLWWFAAEGLQAGWRAVRRRPAAVQPPGFPLGAPVAVAMALLLVPNVSKVLGEVRLAHASDFYAVYDHGHWKPYVAVAGWIKTNALPDARVLSVEGSPLGFLAGRPVLMNAAQCRPGDLLVLEPLEPSRAPRGIPSGGRLMADAQMQAGWKMVEAGAAKEVFQSGKLSVFRVLSGAAPPAPNP